MLLSCRLQKYVLGRRRLLLILLYGLEAVRYTKMLTIILLEMFVASPFCFFFFCRPRNLFVDLKLYT